MNDDSIGSDLDLTHEDPTSRAAVQFETVNIQVTTPNFLGGTSIKLATKVRSGSPMQLALASILIMGVAYGTGVPAMIALITALCAPAAFYILVRLIFDRQTR